LKRASRPCASRYPETPAPAIVETTPSDVMRLITWLPVSATYNVPAASSASADGVLKRASDGAPST
jgi:hypothetical protein